MNDRRPDRKSRIMNGTVHVLCPPFPTLLMTSSTTVSKFHKFPNLLSFTLSRITPSVVIRVQCMKRSAWRLAHGKHSTNSKDSFCFC